MDYLTFFFLVFGGIALGIPIGAQGLKVYSKWRLMRIIKKGKGMTPMTEDERAKMHELGAKYVEDHPQGTPQPTPVIKMMSEEQFADIGAKLAADFKDILGKTAEDGSYIPPGNEDPDMSTFETNKLEYIRDIVNRELTNRTTWKPKN